MTTHEHDAPDSGGASPFGMRGYDAATYGESFADIYDEWYDDLDDADFVDAVVSSLPTSPARVLELGVGTGRLAQAVRDARRGVVDHFHGVDSSTHMLDRARMRLGDGVVLTRGDFSRDLPDGPFDTVFVGYNTLFNLPDDEALDRCLGLVASRLVEGGAFLVDVAMPAVGGEFRARDEVSIRSMTARTVVLTASRVDESGQRITGHFIHLTDGDVVRLRPWSIRVWSTEQMDRIAGRHGLSPERRGSDGHWTPVGADANRHVTLYRKVA